MNWIISNISSILIMLVLAVIVFFCIRSMVKTKKKGGCLMGCPGCTGGSCSHCSSDTPEAKKEK